MLQIYTEMVRLTDTNALQHQTGEKGDYFLWMKYQAKKGLADAQVGLCIRVGCVWDWGVCCKDIKELI